MNIDEEEVERIARLAHLRFSPAERIRMSEEMSAILGYIDQLPAVEISPTASTGPLEAALRPDLASTSLPREVIEKNAPAVAHGFFVVPRIIASGEK